MKLEDHLSTSMRNFLPEKLRQLSMHEQRADCVNCTLACTREQEVVHPNMKCCTYFPYIANYLVGAILERGGEGARRISQWVAHNSYALPVGLCSPPAYLELLSESGQRSFGYESDLLCPFYETTSNSCSVWSQRPGDCSAFFCTSSYGESGLDFWERVDQLLFVTENGLAQMAMVHMGFQPEEVERSLKWVRPLESSLEDKPTEELWGVFKQEKEEFYRQCWAWVSGLDEERAQEVFAGALDEPMARVLAAYEFLDRKGL